MAPTADDGVRHLLLTVDVEKLYRAALGMYDVQLAYLVIAHSQRDPGEYLLELQRFAGVANEHLRRHSIDMHLKRYPFFIPFTRPPIHPLARYPPTGRGPYPCHAVVL